MMKSFFAVVVSVLGAVGLCHADERAAVMPPSADVGTPSRPLKAVLSDFVGNQFVGSVVWRTDDITSPGQLPATAVRAEIEIPDLEMTVSLDLRRNDDRSIAASHTVEIAFALPRGEIANVPGLLMKADEMARGDALNGVSVKVATNVFLFGLSSVEAHWRRNVQLIRERSWIDVPIAYSDGKRANLVVEKAAPGDRAAAVLELPAVERNAPEESREPLSAVLRPPTNIPTVSIKPWPVVAPAPPVALPSSSLNLSPVGRPIWSWPPGRSRWALAPGSPRLQPVLSEAIRVASTIVVPPIAMKPPSWLGDVSTMPITAMAVPPWPRVRAPDFHLPTGRSRFAGEKNLEPPPQFVRWTDRLETVLPVDEVGQYCRILLGKPPPLGKRYRGCTRGFAGRCFIIRVDDPGVARHELAHCNGWRHPE